MGNSPPLQGQDKKMLGWTMLLAILLVPFFGDSDPWPFQRLSDLQRLGIKRLRLESPGCWFFLGSARWVFRKIVGFSPQIIHFNRVFHDFHHPFWGTHHFRKPPVRRFHPSKKTHPVTSPGDTWRCWDDPRWSRFVPLAVLRKSTTARRKKNKRYPPVNKHTVDGRNPAPPGMYKTL